MITLLPDGISRVDFEVKKYGTECLIDVDHVTELTGFLQDGEPHYLSFYEVLLVTRGRGELWLEDRCNRVRSRTVLFTSPGQVRRWRVRGLDGLCLFFTDEFLTDLFRDGLFLQRLSYFHAAGSGFLELLAPEARAVRRELEVMREELRSFREDTRDLLAVRLFDLLLRLNRTCQSHQGRDESRVGSLVFRFNEMVEQRFAEDHTVSRYAEALAVTPGHLNAVVKRHLGITAGQVIRSRVTVEAKRLLLHTDLTSAQIADRLAFADPSYFGRFFRREAGVSPFRFRRQIREKYQIPLI